MTAYWGLTAYEVAAAPSFTTLRLHNVISGQNAAGTNYANIDYATTPGYGWLTAGVAGQWTNNSSAQVSGVTNTEFWWRLGYLLFGSPATYRIKASPSQSLDIRIYAGIVGGPWLYKVTVNGNTTAISAASPPNTYTITPTADGSGFIDLVFDKNPTTAAAIQGFDVAAVGNLPTAWS